MTDETLAAAACALAVTAQQSCTDIIGASYRIHYARGERPSVAAMLIGDIRRSIRELEVAAADIEEALRTKREAA